MPSTVIQRSSGRPQRATAEQMLAVVASFVAIAEALVLFATDTPAQHKWLIVGLAAAVLWTGLATGIDALLRVAALSFLCGAAFVTRITVRFDFNLSWTLATLDTAAAFGAAIAAALAVFTLSRAIGRVSALLAGGGGVMVLGCLCLVLERSPGARLGTESTTVHKGPWPHRTFGQWYPPHSRVRSFYASNPRNYYDPPPPMSRLWQLNLHTGRDLADLISDPKHPSTLRVDISRAEGGEMWGIQLNQPIAVRGGIPYELSFGVRADRTREIVVAISEWHSPYQGLGYYRTISVGPEWLRMVEELTLDRDDARARIHFDVGKERVSVEVADVVLTDLGTGREVHSEPAPFSLTHQFNGLGCRGPEVSSTSSLAGDTRRVLVIGDSYALGLGVRDEDLFGSRLARLLQEIAAAQASGKRAVQVITCAVPGWGTRQERQFYEHLRGRYSPELVIVVTSWNDGRLRRDESPLSSDDERNAVADSAQVAMELRRFAAQVQSDGAHFAVVVFRNTAEASWQPVLDAVAPLTKAAIPILDTWPYLTANGASKPLADETAGCLPNDVAHDLAAAATAGFLREHGFAP